MTIIEYVKKLGYNLNSAQIQLLNFIEEHKDDEVYICFNSRHSYRNQMWDLVNDYYTYINTKGDNK